MLNIIEMTYACLIVALALRFLQLVPLEHRPVVGRQSRVLVRLHR